MKKQSRQTGTKIYIKQALAHLLKEKSFEELSVTSICREAGINRGTFYLHYLDKYDMIDRLKDDTLSHIYEIMTDESTRLSGEVLCAALECIHHDLDFIAILAQSTYINLPQIIRQFLLTLLDHMPELKEKLRADYQIPASYALTAFVASIEAIISQWIATGGQESPQEMATIILTFITEDE